MINPNSQTGKILSYLKSGASITPLEALNLFGSFRLSERIREIAAEGYEIDHEWQKTGKKKVMGYRLKRKVQDYGLKGPMYAPKKAETA